MQLVYNSTGTHTHKDQLKIRLDLYPEKGEKSYDTYYVYVPVYPEEGYTGKVDKEGNPVSQEDYDNWVKSLPHIWQLNPCLSLFIGIDENITKTLLTEFVNDVYTKDVLATIDDSIIKSNSAHLISPYCRTKTKLSTAKTLTFDEQSKLYIDSELSDLSLTKESDGMIDDVRAESIDVGSGATDRTSNSNALTQISKGNPANEDGSIDTFEIWASTSLSDCVAGIFYVVSSNNLSTRDYESIGSVISGSKQTFTGLSISVNTGDYIGTSFSSGVLEMDGTTGDGRWYSASEYIPCTNQAFTASTRGISLYGTGTESGGGGTAYDESFTASLDVGVNLDRDVEWDRASSSGLSLATNLSRALAKFVTSSVGLTTAFNLAKSKGKTITTSANLALSTSFDRAVTYSRAVSQGISTAFNLAKSRNRTIISSTALSLSTSLSRAVSFARAFTNNLSTAFNAIVATAEDTLINFTANLGLSSNFSRAVTYNRDTTSNLSLAINLAKSFGKLIISSVGLSLSTSVNRAVGFTRSTSTALSTAINLVKNRGWTVTTSTALSISTSLSRAIDYTRDISSALDLTVNLSRAIGFTRAFTANLSLTSIVSAVKTAVITIFRRLTLQPRSFNLTLKSRSFSLTLQPRSFNLTLKDRNLE